MLDFFKGFWEYPLSLNSVSVETLLFLPNGRPPKTITRVLISTTRIKNMLAAHNNKSYKNARSSSVIKKFGFSTAGEQSFIRRVLHISEDRC
jgi:hypothetical protein